MLLDILKIIFFWDLVALDCSSQIWPNQDKYHIQDNTTLYGVPLIVNWTGGARPCKTSSNIGDWFNTLMSLFEPTIPK